GPSELLQEGAGVQVADLVGHRAHQAACPAGAETDAGLLHEVGDGNRSSWMVHGTDPRRGCPDSSSGSPGRQAALKALPALPIARGYSTTRHVAPWMRWSSR